jgi:hypothetical protein
VNDEWNDDLSEEQESEFDRLPLYWRGLEPVAIWIWFARLWEAVLDLRERYHLPIRAHWWEDSIQVEALAALDAWIERYDSGEWDDPPGKLQLLLELERLEPILRDGNEPLHPERDRPLFERYLEEVIGAEPPVRVAQWRSSARP